ncbi:ThuA domain-containing protein [Thalassotalea sp. PLHSN55]|uniref:ThuA domain-containing protein n=1 Tax=Thalassotalea sp. PLHSN55 TaxID=3435888 RepID=UPI003F8319A6
MFVNIYTRLKAFLSLLNMSPILTQKVPLTLALLWLTIVNVNHHAYAIDFKHMPNKQFNVLLFTKTNEWHHKSIPTAVQALQKLADKHYFNLVWHEESRYFNDDYLSAVDVVVFLSTTGDVLAEPEQQALQRFMSKGRGFVGIHSASDTEKNWPWFQQLVGHTFVIHPEVQTALLTVETDKFPGMSAFKKSMLWTDEWYDFSPNHNENLTYLLSVDERSYNTKSDWGKVNGKGMGEFHPIAWYQNFAGGRSFYTALGHLPAVYQDEAFLAHVYGGIFWAATGKNFTELLSK